jgi:starch synthase (maltosyl-transferring)
MDEKPIPNISRRGATSGVENVKEYSKRGHVTIERVWPQIDGGRYRPKSVVGDEVTVEADFIRDGPDLLLGVIRYKGPGDARWSEAPMRLIDNDRYGGAFTPTVIGVYKFTIEAWTDHFGTWARALGRRVEAGQDVELELEEGALLLEEHLRLVSAKEKKRLAATLEVVRAGGGSTSAGFKDERVAAILDPGLLDLMRARHSRAGSTTYRPVLEVRVDRERARSGAWYEFFPRSTGRRGRHGTFVTSARLLPKIAAMGFDVVYLPPIHPIGTTDRKGKNNSLHAGPGDVGVPWAIGAADGGHTAVHPQLGTIEDFDEFVGSAARLGIEVALDFAIQCSPDHPWVTEHPEWFHHRPDGTIKYAENPPKKYQDVYPVNFDTANKLELWSSLKEIVDFWIDHGVKIFRVDNPHTKPFHFWEWLIEAVHEEHPEVIFLAEAFTRPKVMRNLAKLGFSQSYTYFTWRNSKWEIIEYLTELTRSEMAMYFRPNFFVNTQDILHEYLQIGGPPAFKIRLVLAAFLSPTYGVYSGFEFFENVPREPGSEEYLDSEKYQLRSRDYGAENTLMPYITQINEIRRKHPPLGRFTNLHFHNADKDNMIAFSKTSPGADPILVVVNLNPFRWEECTVHLDLGVLGLDWSHPFEVQDLITGASYLWHGADNYVRLDPWREPAHIFVVRR